MLITLILEFTLRPIRLEVAHFRPVRVVSGVVEGVFETTLSALAHAVEDEGGDGDGSAGTGTDADTSFGAGG